MNSIEDTAMSYDEWKANGFYVRKGATSRGRCALGVCQFWIDQVVAYDEAKIKYIKSELGKLSEDEHDLYVKGKNLKFPVIDKPTRTPRRGNYIPSTLCDHFESVLFKHHGHWVGSEYDEEY